MNRTIHTFAIIFTLTLTAGSIKAQQTVDFSRLSGPYLGQSPSDTMAQIFAPEIVSTGLEECTIAFTPDGKECFWAVLFTGIETILTSKLVNGHWTKPEVAPFSGKYFDGWPAIQADGKRLFFHSERPLVNSKDSDADINIWYVDKLEEGWSEPRPLGPPVNGTENSACPSVTEDGSLYISKRFPDGSEKICRSKYVNGKYMELEILPNNINIGTYNFHAYISPDESYLIFPNDAIPEKIGSGWNYYISFRGKDNTWSNLINIGKSVNSERSSGIPSISSDGKYFFFQASTRIKWIKEFDKRLTLDEILERQNRIPAMMTNDIYWISTRIFEPLRPKELKDNQ